MRAIFNKKIKKKKYLFDGGMEGLEVLADKTVDSTKLS